LYGCTKEFSLEGVAGLIRFVGSVSALAYLGPKESISEAISDLKVVKISFSTVLSFSPSCIVFHDVCISSTSSSLLQALYMPLSLANLLHICICLSSSGKSSEGIVDALVMKT
jgi:hypothetical protein